MKSDAVIRAAMAEDKITQKDLAQRMGRETQSYVGNVLNRKTDMKVAKFVELMKAMGYDIVARRGDVEFKVTE